MASTNLHFRGRLHMMSAKLLDLRSPSLPLVRISCNLSVLFVHKIWTFSTPHPSVQASYVNVPLFYILRNTNKSHEKGCKNDFWGAFMKAFRSTFCKNRHNEIWRYLWRRCVKVCLENQVALEVNNVLFSMRRQGPSIHFYEPFSRTTALNRLCQLQLFIIKT